MFEELFGLKKRPFGSQATSADVFIGPQTVGFITRAKKIFAEPDAVVSVHGPIGSGKSTIVARALSALGRQHTIISIGRIKLGPDEVIEFLLRELGLKQMPAGTIQKLTVFRNIIKKLAENDIRLFIIVEDAERLGNVALAELEALTATDAGVSDGANLVLMSEGSLKQTFRAPGLARLSQRTRLHYELKPLTAPEVRGYLANGLRQAGGDVAAIIDEDAILAIHALSEGIPRVINGLVSSALDSVAEQGSTRLDLAQVRTVAADEFGLELDDLDERVSSAAPLPAAAVANEKAPAATPEPAREAPEDPEPLVDETQPRKILGTSAPEPPAGLIQDTLPEVAALDSGEYPIPELIQDTLPDLEVLSPELAKSARDEGPAAAEPELPELSQDAMQTPALDINGANAEPELPELIQDTLETPALDVSAENLAAEPEIPELINDTLQTPALDAAPPSPAAEEPEIPELINDTLATPALDTAAAEAPQSAEPELPELINDTLETPALDAAAMTSDDEIPVLFDSSPGMKTPNASEAPQEPAKAESQAAREPDVKETPAWDRDPTMAELKPDLEALEHAMAVAQGLTADDKTEEDEAAETVAEEVPEITLDDSIRRKIDIAEEALKATQSLEQLEQETLGEMAQSETLSTTFAEDLGKVPTRADEELERIAAELAKAKTIEDVDDKMAETLFGEEFTMIAAELAANAPQSEPEPAEPTIEELSLAATGTSLKSPVAESAAADPAAEQSSMEKEFMEVYGEEAVDISMETPKGGIDSSASQRLATVRALNASSKPSGGQARRATNEPEPEPIEDQINTSITQTLKALSAKQIEEKEEEDEVEEKSGFFSRFRKP